MSLNDDAVVAIEKKLRISIQLRAPRIKSLEPEILSLSNGSHGGGDHLVTDDGVGNIVADRMSRGQTLS
jgi:hypothetical protein